MSAEAAGGFQVLLGMNGGLTSVGVSGSALSASSFRK